jgi:hypothetical protein
VILREDVHGHLQASRGHNLILPLLLNSPYYRKEILPWALVLADTAQILRRTAMELIK